MPLILFMIACISYQLFADGVANDQQYYTKNIKNVQLIYSEQNIKFASQASSIEEMLHPQYEDTFHWKLDEKLYVGLMSDSNQIANGYSTPFPNNRQINFIGGSTQIDYFTSTSWLNTLLYHETAHNYQSNVKSSRISRTLHSLFGNGAFYALTFTYPNLVESSFFLEGNAVLNESLHQNGGRLWSGRFKAETILQAKAGYITPSRTYNDHLYFPYKEHNYIIGGFFEKYLAERFSLPRVNSYFKKHSAYWLWPFMTNWATSDTFDENYEDLIDDFSDYMKKSAKNFHKAQGEVIATSQFFTPLNRDDNNIFFLINENGREVPKLLNYEIDTGSITKFKRSFLSGKVIKDKNLFYTQASHSTSATKVYQGLFDDEATIKSGSEGRVIQGYLKDGKAVYFDVSSSFDQAQLYVGDKFYAQVNSSVFIDKKDNLYYFVQKGDKRVLYKNRESVISFKGYYSIVSDVLDDGSIYFVANSQLGSTLFCYYNSTITRVSRADNIVEAKVLNKKEFLLAAISADEYYYVISDSSLDIETPYYEELKIKEYHSEIKRSEPLTLENKYSAISDLHYSGMDFTLNSNDSYNINFSFADPLVQNSIEFYLNKAEAELLVGGVSYSSTQYIVNYSLSAFSLLDRNISKEYKKLYGISAVADYNFLKSGYNSADLVATYYSDLSATREPISLSFALGRVKHFGVSKYSSEENRANLFITQEREDTTLGADLFLQYDIFDETYLCVNSKYSYSTTPTFRDARGVKVSSNQLSFDNDPSIITMSSFNRTLYLQDVFKVGGDLKQVFNYGVYFFTFPLSLRREVVSFGYNYYHLNLNDNYLLDVNELSSTFTMELLLANKLPIDFNISYYYNDIYKKLRDESVYQMRFTLGTSF